VWKAISLNTKENQMQKVLEKYKANPTAENLAKLIAHANKHPFSVCVMPMQDQKFLHTLLA